jgi:hypothetical protein
MTIDPDRFKQSDVDTLSRRAASQCSNPDCGAITSGPASDTNRSVTVGEAAHIYGAKPSAARYDPGMTPAERSAITNSIWLCRNCHKIADADPGRFPAALLFEWRDEHERRIAEQMGKTGERLRRKVIDRELEGFDSASYLSRQIVIDKPDAWEYRLIAELLRSKLDPLASRWRALKESRYAKPITIIPSGDALDWFHARLTEVTNLLDALKGIITHELQMAWGAPGEPGSPKAILSTCDLFQEACQQLLAWEERIRFAHVPQNYREMARLFAGIGGRIFEQVGAIPGEMANLFAGEMPTGKHHINIVIDMPDDWERQMAAAFRRITDDSLAS